MQIPTQPPRRRAPQRPGAGFCERLAFYWMAQVLEAGWTPEKGAQFYGGMSEEQMRSAVWPTLDGCGFLK